MSEFWVSKKKYYCKYCEIYIADDAPSRNHHESGMRHKGNRERFIRGIYKTGEKRKKDLEEEKREMARVEQLANAAFADDVGAGRAAPVAGPSKPVARRAAPGKDSGGPWANYSTAESLGLTDPDAERLANEAEIRRSQGTAGEWEVVSVTPTPAPEPQDEGEEDVKPDVAAVGEKRLADAAGVDEEDTRSYKLRKKTLNPGGLLGDVYDPGMIPIKVRKREEPVKQEETVTKEEEPLPPPSFRPLQLKPSKDATDRDQATTEPAPSSLAPKWSKSGWGAAGPSPPMPAPPPPPLAQAPSPAEETPAPITKEGETDVKPSVTDLKPAEAPAPVFKKRKAPASSARGRRPI